MPNDSGRSLPDGLEIRSLAGFANLRPSQGAVAADTPIAVTTVAKVTEQPASSQQSTNAET